MYNQLPLLHGAYKTYIVISNGTEKLSIINFHSRLPCDMRVQEHVTIPRRSKPGVWDGFVCVCTAPTWSLQTRGHCRHWTLHPPGHCRHQDTADTAPTWTLQTLDTADIRTPGSSHHPTNWYTYQQLQYVVLHFNLQSTLYTQTIAAAGFIFQSTS